MPVKTQNEDGHALQDNASQWTEQEQLQFVVDTDLRLMGKVPEELIEALEEKGYQLTNGKVEPIQPEFTLPIPEKATLTVNETDILAMSEKIQQNQMEDMAFINQLDKFLNAQLNSSESITVGTTPYILHLVGATAEILTINQSVVQNSLNSENVKRKDHTEGHNIAVDVLKQLPEHLRNPIMICSGSKKGTVVAITGLQDKKGKRIIVPISIDVNGKKGIVNKIASVYGKNNIQNYLQNAIKNNQILAYNEEKAEALTTVIGCQLPQASSAICFDNSIAYSTQNVKGSLDMLQKETVQEQPKTSAPVEKKSEQFHQNSSPKKDFIEKLNPEYYHSLASNDRCTKIMPDAVADKAIQQLSDTNISVSAARRAQGMTAITVHKVDECKLDEAVKAAAIQTAHTNKTNKETMGKVNPEFYHSLPRVNRHITILPFPEAKSYMQELQNAGCQFSAVQRNDGKAAVTIDKADSKAMQIFQNRKTPSREFRITRGQSQKEGKKRNEKQTEQPKVTRQHKKETSLE